jgi:hypothetical protein
MKGSRDSISVRSRTLTIVLKDKKDFVALNMSRNVKEKNWGQPFVH